MNKSPDGSFERVHTVTEYHDQPLKGIADYKGMPHAYRRLFREDIDDYSDEYVLKPIDTRTFELAMEAWGICLRYLTARDKGEVANDAHPALPRERPRYNEIEAAIESVLSIPDSCSLRIVGRFRPKRGTGSRAEWEICWIS